MMSGEGSNQGPWERISVWLGELLLKHIQVQIRKADTSDSPRRLWRNLRTGSGDALMVRRDPLAARDLHRLENLIAILSKKIIDRVVVSVSYPTGLSELLEISPSRSTVKIVA